MAIFESTISLISFVTGIVFLWLNRGVRRKEYSAFSIICFSAGMYMLMLSVLVSHQDNLPSVYRYQRVAICVAVFMVLFVVRFVSIISGRGNKHFLYAFYLLCVILGLMSLFDIHFFDDSWNHYAFIIGHFEIATRAPGFGYRLFGMAVMIGSVYAITALILAWHINMEYILPSLLGISVLAIFGIYDILWIQRIIAKPLHPMAEFGVLAMIGGMSITLIIQFIDMTGQVKTMSNKLEKAEQQNNHLRSIILKNFKKAYLNHRKSESQPFPDEFIEQVAAICEKNLSNFEFGPGELAEALHVTRIQLNRKIKKLTNKTTSEFMRTMRLEYAAELLKKNSATITHIAYEAGFENLSYFNRCFKKHFGVKPSDYRKGNK